MEVMVGTRDDEQDRVRSFLSRFRQTDIDAKIAETAATIRRSHEMRLPDAIIWASAQHQSALLISRDTKDFPVDTPGIRIPCTL